MALDVPVLATPTGAHPQTVGAVPGCHCAPWDPESWRAALSPHLRTADPRVPGRPIAELHGTAVYAERLVDTWRTILSGA